MSEERQAENASYEVPPERRTRASSRRFVELPVEVRHVYKKPRMYNKVFILIVFLTLGVATVTYSTVFYVTGHFGSLYTSSGFQSTTEEN